ncbi:MAG: H/ACA ribonucleoprotein complex subunit GAR1 [Methanohalobium sp.]|uniref:H/ACA ribonucleoprotein complex subunit GAR1 n=1 Tax=Methanohalobium sp. TaxID=2837493 RepID=UPI00397801DD
MKKLGIVSHLSKNHNIIVRMDELKPTDAFKKAPKINSVVLNKAVKPVGKINDIIGPVSRPYVVIKVSNKITNSELQNYVNERVYIK